VLNSYYLVLYTSRPYIDMSSSTLNFFCVILPVYEKNKLDSFALAREDARIPLVQYNGQFSGLFARKRLQFRAKLYLSIYPYRLNLASNYIFIYPYRLNFEFKLDLGGVGVTYVTIVIIRNLLFCPLSIANGQGKREERT
jgi:hypothetical protein